MSSTGKELQERAFYPGEGLSAEMELVRAPEPAPPAPPESADQPAATPDRAKRPHALSVNTLLLIVTQVLTKGISVFSAAFLARAFEREILGTIRQASFYISTVEPFFLLGLPATLLYFVPLEKNIESKHARAREIIFAIHVSALALFLFFVFSGTLIANVVGNPLLMIAFPFMAAVGAFTAAQRFSPDVGIALGRIQPFLLANISAPAIVVMGAFATYWFHLGMTTYLTLLVAGLGVSYLINIGCLVNFVGCRFAFPKLSTFRSLASYGFPLMLNKEATLLGRGLDALLISIFFPANVFAGYSLGAIPLPFASIVRGKASAAAMPEAVKLLRDGSVPEVVKLHREVVRKSALLVIPPTIFVILNVYAFVEILYTNKYLDAAPILFVYAFLPLRRLFGVGYVLRAAGRTMLILKLECCLFAMNALLTPIALFVTRAPIAAAITTVACSFAILCLEMHVAARHILQTSITKLVKWKAMVSGVVLLAGAGAASLYLSACCSNHLFVSMIINGAIYAVATPAMLWYSGLLGKSEIAFAQHILRRFVGR